MGWVLKKASILGRGRVGLDVKKFLLSVDWVVRLSLGIRRVDESIVDGLAVASLKCDMSD